MPCSVVSRGWSAEIGFVPSLPLSWLHVMNWTGLRGAVATALALSIPIGAPDRELLQGIVFGIVLFTLIVQGTTAERVRWAGVQRTEGGEVGADSRDSAAAVAQATGQDSSAHEPISPMTRSGCRSHGSRRGPRTLRCA